MLAAVQATMDDVRPPAGVSAAAAAEADSKAMAEGTKARPALKERSCITMSDLLPSPFPALPILPFRGSAAQFQIPWQAQAASAEHAQPCTRG